MGPGVLLRQDAQAGRSFAAGAAYFGVVFALGFMVGTLRVLVVEPRLGATASVSVEVPFMLLASWMVARHLVARFDLGRLRKKLVMGVTGLVLLLAAETALGVAFGQPIGEQLATYGTLRGILNLVGQLGFAAMPLLVRWPRSDS